MPSNFEKNAVLVLIFIVTFLTSYNLFYSEKTIALNSSLDEMANIEPNSTSSVYNKFAKQSNFKQVVAVSTILGVMVTFLVYNYM